jgi:hypothetical protein
MSRICRRTAIAAILATALVTLGLTFAPAALAAPPPVSCLTAGVGSGGTSTIALDWNDVTWAAGSTSRSYDVHEDLFNGFDNLVATVAVSNRTSGTLNPGTYRYYVVAKDSTGTAAASPKVTVTVPVSGTVANPVGCDPNATTPPPPPPPPPTGLDPAAWQAAFDTHNHQTLLSWFDANVTGPRQATVGTSAGGTISTQTQADAVSGTQVTGDMTVSCSCTLHDFTTNSQINITGANVTLQYFKQDGLNQTARTDLFVVATGAHADLYAARILHSQDGIRTGGNLTGQYIYISDPSTSNPLDHHQDAIQQYGGQLSVSRSALNYVGSNTSTLLIKPDSSNITQTSWTNDLIMGGGYTIHLHDDQPCGCRTISASGLSFTNDLVARGYANALASVWHVNQQVVTKAASQTLIVSTVDGGGTRALRDGVVI